MKKTITLLLALCMVVSLFTVGAMASGEASGETSGEASGKASGEASGEAAAGK